MRALRYIHAADLHLDAPFGNSQSLRDSSLADHLRKAAFTALKRLCALCERKKPDFLVIAGDIYNQENHSIKAQLALRDACARLERSAIPVFLAHGNHDSLSSRLTAVRWPENVTIFGSEVAVYPVERDGETVALVHGASHEMPGESRNLSRFFTRDAKNGNCFQLGVLHATVGGQSAKNYAPCTLADLRESGLDAWALGHIHKRAVLSRQPFIAYSGSIQGLHVNEPGPHGCLVVAARYDGVDWVCDHAFQPLAPVQWDEVECDLEQIDSLDEVEERLAGALGEVCAGAGEGCEALVARIVLKGRTRLDGILRQKAAQDDLAGRLRHLAGIRTCLWIKDISCRTRKPHVGDPRRDDILGEVLRLAAALRTDHDSFRNLADTSLKPLYEHQRAGKVLSPLHKDALQSLLLEAELLCEDRLDPNQEME
ncbi:MAG: DNA repair exonuclease [Desulfovibrio sp.]|jgi:DNA repair exonuclease SbcCD nuclease subunit|nr:DNA repair exonuclease [Desulfovibrio sp.]